MPMKKMLPNLPTNSQRIAIVGRTGSGKTVAGLWHLSKQNYHKQPWIIVDYKMDENINSIKNAIHIELKDTPKKPGIYIVHPRPNDEEKVTALLYRVWERENIGIYIDEGYMLGNRNPALNVCLTQGRSKHIPMIVLSQRPVWLTRFVFSESDFFQIFQLNDKDDRKTVERFLNENSLNRLPDY